MDAVVAPTQVDPAFRADVLAGLAAPIPAVPARWLYDRRGSELFEAITRLPEYYPTRTEMALLELQSGEIADQVGSGQAVVEFGSGSSTKTPILLRAASPAAYVPIDISGDFLREAAETLAASFPALPVIPVEADEQPGAGAEGAAHGAQQVDAGGRDQIADRRAGKEAELGRVRDRGGEIEPAHEIGLDRMDRKARKLSLQRRGGVAQEVAADVDRHVGGGMDGAEQDRRLGR